MQDKRRLRELLNAGPVELQPIPGRDQDCMVGSFGLWCAMADRSVISWSAKVWLESGPDSASRGANWPSLR